MQPNLDRYKKDIDALLAKGANLHLTMRLACFPEDTRREVDKVHGKKAKLFLETLHAFGVWYQSWYSEAKVLVKQMLPDRLADFTRYYEIPKPRTDSSHKFLNYTIQDYLQRLTPTPQEDHLQQLAYGVGDREQETAMGLFRQQLAIVESVKARFESSLFDIRQLVQADLFDSELDAAKELAKHKFTRAAGAVAGVVLEKHLAQVCDNHAIKVVKKNPGISDLNDALKAGNVIDFPQWRSVQVLADIRNLCDHNKGAEPSPEQVDDLVTGVTKVIKTLF